MNGPDVSRDAMAHSEAIVVRPLTADDSVGYAELRQRILERGDGKYFGSSYVREASFTTVEHWRDWCTPTEEHCTIGTFASGRLIGITGIVRVGSHALHTAEWEVTWLDPQYRNLGLGRKAHEEKQRWTKAHGYQYAVSLVRADNALMLETCGKRGDVYVHTKHDERWADGSVADVHYFITCLSAACTAVPEQRLIQDILSALAHGVTDPGGGGGEREA